MCHQFGSRSNPGTCSGVLVMLAALGLCAAANDLRAAAFVFETAGTYDPTGLNSASGSNSVDFNANGTVATTNVGPTDYAQFKATVASAFTNGLGGVVDFETNNITRDGIQAVAVNTNGNPDAGGSINFSTQGATPIDTASFRYASGAKSLAVKFDRTMRTGSTFSAQPISGSRYLDTPVGTDTNSSQSYTITFGNITGGIADEHVTTFGLTITSRNDGGKPSTNVAATSMTATYSGGLSSTLSSDVAWGGNGSTQGPGQAGLDDTFFGFVAPSGQWITSVSVTRIGPLPFDELGFISSAVTAVPEPGCVGLIGLAALTQLARRRRSSSK